MPQSAQFWKVSPSRAVVVAMPIQSGYLSDQRMLRRGSVADGNKKGLEVFAEVEVAGSNPVSRL